MSVDVIIENNVKAQSAESNVETGQMNGYSNGHHSSSSIKHKSSSKDKHRHKDYDKDRKSSHSKDTHKSSSRDKEKHHGSSSSKDKHRDRDNSKHSSSSNHREKDKEKGKHKSISSSSSTHHKSSSKDKDRHKNRDHKDSDDRKERSGSNSSGKEKTRSHHKSSNSASRDKSKDHHHRTISTSSSATAKHKHSTSSSSSKIPKLSLKSGADFIKPEPLSQENIEIRYKNGLNVLLEKEKDQINYENERSIKEETDISFNASAASSCDYSMSQFQYDEATFVKKEASCDEDSRFNQIKTNNDNDDEEDDVPLSKRKSINTFTDHDEMDDDVPLAKRKIKDEDDEDVPLISRKKIKKEIKEKSVKSKLKRVKDESDDFEKPKKKISKKSSGQIKQAVSPSKRQKKEAEDEEVWRWWEEEKREDGVKWNSLEHKGPVFAPPYERLPKNVRFFYDGKPMQLTEATEEAATFYAKMLNHDYCTKQIFNDNFFQDFRKTMVPKELETIKHFKKCNFEEMHRYFVAESEKRKNSTKEDKQKKKEENEALIKEYGTCLIDGHKEKIGNFRLEPPGLFRGRGEHPKMGMIKRRIQAEDVSINCGASSKVPSPPPGHHWKDVRHDNTVTWLASWIENVQGQVKYIMLNPSSKLKGEKDHVKYETARRLAKCIDSIRSTYRDEWKSKEMRVRQRAVALYFIDKLALRAGNEKDEDQADTVGCCSLRVEHVQLHKELNGKEYVVVFDFLGKDSIRYYNEVEVEKRVFKNLELFMENKKDGDDLFDRLNTQVLNEHLKELMDGLTAKVFRTYNASITLQNQLDLLTEESMTVPEKLLAYNRANRAVAILCNHQRSIPKGHEKSMENLKEKIRSKREAIDECSKEYEKLKKLSKRGSVKERILADKKSNQLERLKEQLKKLKLQETDRDENKTIALGTSKLNYLDPRISVAWCKKYQVPIEKIFNKTQRNKFLWAIHMADENYRF